MRFCNVPQYHSPTVPKYQSTTVTQYHCILHVWWESIQVVLWYTLRKTLAKVVLWYVKKCTLNINWWYFEFYISSASKFTYNNNAFEVRYKILLNINMIKYIIIIIIIYDSILSILLSIYTYTYTYSYCMLIVNCCLYSLLQYHDENITFNISSNTLYNMRSIIQYIMII